MATSISFIIPYYKIGRILLQRCIDSIRRLGNGIDWEIRVIDDESPDNEAFLCVEEYADQRIHYTRINHSGLGGARNCGIEEAQKEYIMFVDSDDYIFTEHLQTVLEIIENCNSDTLVFTYHKTYTQQTESEPDYSFQSVLYNGDAITYMSENDIAPSACRYLIRREVLGDLRFTPNLLHEDEEFTALLFLHINRLTITDIPLYAYYQRSGSITNRHDEKFLSRRFADLRQILIRLNSLYQSFPSSDTRHMAYRRRTAILAMCYVVNLIRSASSIHFFRLQISQLRNIGLYPLPAGNYGWRYNLIRFATFI